MQEKLSVLQNARNEFASLHARPLRDAQLLVEELHRLVGLFQDGDRPVGLSSGIVDGMSARQRILDAAESLVLRQGFAATTVDAVLAEAGASKGAFFHHFPSKAALGRALVERYAQRDAAALEEAIAAAEAASDDPAAQLVALARTFEEGADDLLALQPQCLFVSFIYESALSGVGAEDVVAGSIRHWRHRIVGKLREEIERDMKLMGVRNVGELTRENLRWR